MKQLIKPIKTQKYEWWAIVNEDLTKFYCEDQEMGYPSAVSNIRMSHSFALEDTANRTFERIKNNPDKEDKLYKAFAKGRVVPITVEVFVNYSEGHS